MTSPFMCTVRRLLLAGALVASALAAPASAQITYRDLAWGSPPDSVRARLEAAGFRHVRTYENGDLRFRSAADVVVVASFGPRGLVRVEELHRAPADGPARLRAAVDSMTRAYGAEPQGKDGLRWWLRGLTAADAELDPGQGTEPATLSLGYYGPGSRDEMARRTGDAARFAPLDSAWVSIAADQSRRLAVDTASIERRAQGVWRVRLRMDLAEPAREMADGSPYNTLVYGSDYDCAGRRSQLRSRTSLMNGRRVRHDAHSTVWAPARAGTMAGWQLDMVCEYIRQRRPASAP